MAARTLSILHVFPSFSMGGQQRRLATLISSFGDAFRHKIISLDGDISGAALLANPGVAVERFSAEKSGFISFRNVWRLKRALNESGADLLCTYNFGSIEAALANRLGPNLPHIHHEDGFGPDEAGGRQKARRILARRTLLSRSTIVVPSNTLEILARDVWRLNQGRVRRIPVGIDIAAFSAPRDYADTVVTVGSLGALRAEKNFLRLIRCFAEASRGSAARLEIHGEGPERHRLAAAARDTAASDRIELPGASHDATATMRRFDIFALSSDTEQTPTSLIEAMASGLPCIATAVGDVPQMLGDCSSGFIAASDEEFAAGLRRLIFDADLRRRLGEENRRRAATFDKTAMVDAFRALYSAAANDANAR